MAPGKPERDGDSERPPMHHAGDGARPESTMTPDPVLSIVVVNWNTRDLLLSLLARLFTAPQLPFEVLVIDNQSADDSVAAASTAFPAAIVLPQPRNGGFAYGVNFGLEVARGRWILLLNTDAEAHWDELCRFIADAEREPAAAVFGRASPTNRAAPRSAPGQRTGCATTCRGHCSSAGCSPR